MDFAIFTESPKPVSNPLSIIEPVPARKVLNDLFSGYFLLFREENKMGTCYGCLWLSFLFIFNFWLLESSVISWTFFNLFLVELNFRLNIIFYARIPFWCCFLIFVLENDICAHESSLRAVLFLRIFVLYWIWNSMDFWRTTKNSTLCHVQKMIHALSALMLMTWMTWYDDNLCNVYVEIKVINQNEVW